MPKASEISPLIDSAVKCVLKKFTLRAKNNIPNTVPNNPTQAVAVVPEPEKAASTDPALALKYE